MSTLEAIALYVVVAAVIVGFIAVFKFMLKIKAQSELMDTQRESSTWVWARGTGKGIEPLRPWPRHSHQGTMPRWASAYNEHEDVYFNDPADAYEYVIMALADLNRDIDRLENTVDKGVASHCKHMQREYWLNNLKEFREDT
jgi:hypothetical protein